MEKCFGSENNSCYHEQKCISIIPTSAKLSFSDIVGSWKVRWGINRMKYTVTPGLYSIGDPDDDSLIFVTANYKMSFDCLRKELANIDAFILVLDTRGINVWCAAAKGTFGTEELINKINSTNLHQLVSDHTLILPQLSAVGIAAHEVKIKTGFTVIYGPVRAKDIPGFLKNGRKATKKMRMVNFSFADRIVLTPIEIVGAIKPTLIILGVAFLLNLLFLTHITKTEVFTYLSAVLAGCFVVPILLPFIPMRAFTLKGWAIGFLLTIGVVIYNGWLSVTNYDLFKTLSYLLIFPSISSFYAFNFTGSTTFTSESGVNKETKVALPVIFGSIGIGLALIFVQNLLV